MCVCQNEINRKKVGHKSYYCYKLQMLFTKLLLCLYTITNHKTYFNYYAKLDQAFRSSLFFVINEEWASNYWLCLYRVSQKSDFLKNFGIRKFIFLNFFWAPRSNFMRGIDCAYSRSVKTRFWFRKKLALKWK